MLSTSGFVDDVMFAHNRIGKGDAKKSCILSDSPGAEGIPWAKFGYCIV